jgi:hypothetical protein
MNEHPSLSSHENSHVYNYEHIGFKPSDPGKVFSTKWNKEKG